MSTQFTDYLKEGLLNHYFKATQYSNSGRSSIVAALHTAAPGASGSDANRISSIPAQTVTFGAVTDHAVANDSTITFDTSSAAGGEEVKFIAVYGNDGQMLAYGEAAPNLTVSAGTDIEVSAGGLAIGVDTNSLNTPEADDMALVDAVVDSFMSFVFKLTAVPSEPSNHYFCYADTYNAAGTGASWAGQNQLVSFSGPTAGTGDAAKVSNASEIAFTTTQAQNLGMWVIKDESYNPIALKKLSGAAVVLGATATMAADDLQISID